MLEEFSDDADVLYLDLTGEKFERLGSECNKLAFNALDMEDPILVNPVGLEVRIEATFGDVTLRGIIDRLEQIGRAHV